MASTGELCARLRWCLGRTRGCLCGHLLYAAALADPLDTLAEPAREEEAHHPTMADELAEMPHSHIALLPCLEGAVDAETDPLDHTLAVCSAELAELCEGRVVYSPRATVHGYWHNATALMHLPSAICQCEGRLRLVQRRVTADTNLHS